MEHSLCLCLYERYVEQVLYGVVDKGKITFLGVCNNVWSFRKQNNHTIVTSHNLPTPFDIPNKLNRVSSLGSWPQKVNEWQCLWLSGKFTVYPLSGQFLDPQKLGFDTCSHSLCDFFSLTLILPCLPTTQQIQKKKQLFLGSSPSKKDG